MPTLRDWIHRQLGETAFYLLAIDIWSMVGAVIAILLLFGLFRHMRRRPGFPEPNAARRIWFVAIPVSAIVWLGLAIVSIRYATFPGFHDHVVPNIVTLSWWLQQGHTPYPPLADGSGLIGLLYGPVVYLVFGGVLSINPGILFA